MDTRGLRTVEPDYQVRHAALIEGALAEPHEMADALIHEFHHHRGLWTERGARLLAALLERLGAEAADTTDVLAPPLAVSLL